MKEIKIKLNGEVKSIVQAEGEGVTLGLRAIGNTYLSGNMILTLNDGDVLSIEEKEVIQPVDFLTAYKDCLENGTFYKSETPYKDKHIYLENNDGNVMMTDLYLERVSINLTIHKWIKEV